MLGPLPTTTGPGFEPQHLLKTTTFLFKCVHVLERERERGHEREMCMCVWVYHGAYVTVRIVSFSYEYWGSNSDHQAWRQGPLPTDLSC